MRYSWAEDATLEGKALKSVSSVAEGLHCRATDDKGHANGVAPNGPRKWKENAPGVMDECLLQDLKSDSCQLGWWTSNCAFFLFKGNTGTTPPGTCHQKLKCHSPGRFWWEGGFELVGVIRTLIFRGLHFKCSALFLDLRVVKQTGSVSLKMTSTEVWGMIPTQRLLLLKTRGQEWTDEDFLRRFIDIYCYIRQLCNYRWSAKDGRGVRLTWVFLKIVSLTVWTGTCSWSQV